MVNITIKSSTDILKELNEELTSKTKQFDVFDIEVHEFRLEKFIEMLVLRKFKYVVTDIIINDKRTVTVGKIGANFAQHEAER